MPGGTYRTVPPTPSVTPLALLMLLTVLYKAYIAGQSSVSPLLFTRTQNARKLRAINPQFSQNSFCDYSVSGKMNYEDYFWQIVFKNNPCMQKKSNLTPDESMRAFT